MFHVQFFNFFFLIFFFLNSCFIFLNLRLIVKSSHKRLILCLAVVFFVIPLQSVEASTKAYFTPDCCNWYAHKMPVIPPPIIKTSVFISCFKTGKVGNVIWSDQIESMKNLHFWNELSWRMKQKVVCFWECRTSNSHLQMHRVLSIEKNRVTS